MTTAADVRRCRHGETLPPEDRATLERLCEQELSCREIMAAFTGATGRAVTSDTILKTRQRVQRRNTVPLGRSRRLDVGTQFCGHCGVAHGEYPGQPHGVAGRICKRCIEVLRDERDEAQWAAAQQRYQQSRPHVQR